MPIYEYECDQCRRRFSLLRPMAQREEPARCPECEQETGRPVVSLIARPACGPAG